MSDRIGPTVRYRTTNDALEATRVVLDRCSVAVKHYRTYLAFARKVDDLTCRYGSNTLLLAVENLLQKFAKRGLDAAVLADIRFHVFTLGAPRAY